MCCSFHPPNPALENACNLQNEVKPQNKKPTDITYALNLDKFWLLTIELKSDLVGHDGMEVGVMENFNKKK